MHGACPQDALMPPYTLLLVRSGNPAWEGLRHATNRMAGTVYDPSTSILRSAVCSVCRVTTSANPPHIRIEIATSLD